MEDVSSYANKLKRVLLLLFNILELLSTVSSKLIPDSSNVIGGEDGRPRRSQEPRLDTYVLTQHFGTGDRVGLFLMARYDLSPGALYELQASKAITLVETTTYYLDSSERSFCYSYNFTVVRMITTKRQFTTVRRDYFRQLKGGFQVVTWILSIEARKDWVMHFCFVGCASIRGSS